MLLGGFKARNLPALAHQHIIQAFFSVRGLGLVETFRTGRLDGLKTRKAYAVPFFVSAPIKLLMLHKPNSREPKTYIFSEAGVCAKLHTTSKLTEQFPGAPDVGGVPRKLLCIRQRL